MCASGSTWPQPLGFHARKWLHQLGREFNGANEQIISDLALTHIAAASTMYERPLEPPRFLCEMGQIMVPGHHIDNHRLIRPWQQDQRGLCRTNRLEQQEPHGLMDSRKGATNCFADVSGASV